MKISEILKQFKETINDEKDEEEETVIPDFSLEINLPETKKEEEMK